MKLLSYATGGRESYGAVIGKGIVDLTRKFGAEFPDLKAVLESGILPRVAEYIVGRAPDALLEEIEYLPPIKAPEKIACLGVNYRNRNAEYRDGSEESAYPSVFTRTADSLVGHRANIVRPPESKSYDYEGEIAIIIGKTGRRIPKEDAHKYIAGLTCMNEGTIRDWLQHGKFNVTQGKNFSRSGSIGPWITTADEYATFTDIRIRTRVNGEIRQNDSTANLIYSFADIINYLSTFFVLRPGDIISTGTPLGAGDRLEPPRYLQPGDRIEVEVGGVGTLVNAVVDEIDDTSGIGTRVKC